MGIEMWFKDDLQHILTSANASSAATAECAPGPGVQMYRRGYQAALMAVALACGIAPDQVGIRWDADGPGNFPVPGALWLERCE